MDMSSTGRKACLDRRLCSSSPDLAAAQQMIPTRALARQQLDPENPQNKPRDKDFCNPNPFATPIPQPGVKSIRAEPPLKMHRPLY